MNKTVTCKKTKTKDCRKPKFLLDKRKPLMEAATANALSTLAPRERMLWSKLEPRP